MVNITQNTQLKEYNSFQTSASARYFCQPQSVDQIIEALTLYPHEQVLILGGGCNTFFTHDYDGLVIRPDLKGLTEKENTSDSVFIEVMASEGWDAFVEYCVAKGYAGIENLSLIPGTVGAAPVQNIGAYGAEVKDVIHSVTVLDRVDNQIHQFFNQDCAFGYRDSIFKKTGQYIILSVTFKLNKTFEYKPKYKDLNDELSPYDKITLPIVRDAVISVRRRKLPDEKQLPNCGSYFKNPTIAKVLAEQLKQNYPDCPLFEQPDGKFKTSAAFFIDRAGFKGKRDGNIGCYQNQPLILVNYGTVDGNEIVAFASKIQKTVFEKFGIYLEPEVRIF